MLIAKSDIHSIQLLLSLILWNITTDELSVLWATMVIVFSILTVYRTFTESWDNKVSQQEKQ